MATVQELIIHFQEISCTNHNKRAHFAMNDAFRQATKLKIGFVFSYDFHLMISN